MNAPSVKLTPQELKVCQSLIELAKEDLRPGTFFEAFVPQRGKDEFAAAVGVDAPKATFLAVKTAMWVGQGCDTLIFPQERRDKYKSLFLSLSSSGAWEKIHDAHNPGAKP